MAETYDYDLFVIGAGSGGVRASRLAAASGARVAVCEDSRVGGTCVIRGCIPKKLLIYGAHYRDDFEDAAAYGWNSHLPEFDWGKLIRNKDREIDRLNGIYIGLLKNAGVEIIEGRGRLIDEHTVQVGERAWSAKHILISTGARPYRLDIPGAEHAITSNEALELPDLPRRIVIVGGGYIAVEFAGIFANLGSEVTMIIRREELLYGFDDDLRVALAQAMRAKGVEIHICRNVSRVEHDEAGCNVFTDIGQEYSADAVMFATGRMPNTSDLGLDDVGVKTDGIGAVEVDDYSQTSVPGIYAVGDCTNRLNLTPVALHEGQCFVETVYRANPTKPDYSNVPSAVFSDPPIGSVGLTEKAARRACRKVDIYKSRFRPLKHTLTGRDEFSFMKLVVDGETDRVVGCHMLGADAPEIVQGLGIALKCGATKAQFDATIGIHPTAAEEFVTMRTKEPESEKQAAE